MNSAQYQLNIKSANQKVDDYSLQCRSSWTVFRLKQHISETHVNKPNVADQRLIYAGTLLKDSLTLKQVFFRDSLCTELTNANKTEFTIHLVCSNSNAQKTQQRQQQATTAGIGSTTGASASASQNQRSTTAPPTVDSTSQTASSTTQLNPSAAGPSTASNASSPHANQTSRPAGTQTSTTAPLMNNEEASEFARDLLLTEPVRQQLSSYQILANLVAAELVQHLALSLNRDAATTNTTNDTSLTTPQMPMNIAPLLNSQPVILQTLNQAAAATAIAANSTNAAVTQNEHNNHVAAANSIATQLLYAGGQPNQNEHNLNGDDHANGPHHGVVAHQPDDRPQFPGFNQQAQAAAVVAGPRQQAQAPQAPVMDQPVPAQAVNQDGGLQHDVIDWIYYSIRAVVLMAALYIHASFFRLLFIFVLLAIAFFFNRRSARRQQNQQPRAAAAAAPAARQNAAQQPQPAGDGGGGGQRAAVAQAEAAAPGAGELRQRRAPNENGGNGQNDDQNNGDPAEQGQQAEVDDVAQRRVSFLKLCYLVVTDFLASLVPE